MPANGLISVFEAVPDADIPLPEQSIFDREPVEVKEWEDTGTPNTELAAAIEEEMKISGKEIDEPMYDFLAALAGDSDAEFEEIQDDFVLCAMQGDLLPDPAEAAPGPGSFGPFGDLDQYPDEDEEDNRPKTYQQLALENDFARLMREYDDEEIGELDRDDEQVQGKISDIMAYTKTFDAHIEEEKKLRGHFAPPITQEEKDGTKNRLSILETLPEPTEKEIEDDIASLFPAKPEEKWDCESVISTYSNLENHPHMIKEPRRSSGREIKLNAQGMPVGVIPERRRGRQAKLKEQEAQEQDVIAEEEDESEQEHEEPVNLGKKRNKGETKVVFFSC
jgi:hypothetical protein